jgi:hypothetical protein
LDVFLSSSILIGGTKSHRVSALCFRETILFGLFKVFNTKINCSFSKWDEGDEAAKKMRIEYMRNRFRNEYIYRW